ncbi:response regulator transcription factor [Burkholderia ubonensis]|uniref:response regulator transcription factor n=1 Tax=Burkholderia ubonensis TaxID=101571 RepID=UPI0009B3E4F0|nr:response regulator transcription factor [Burkholderia ubonensis]
MFERDAREGVVRFIKIKYRFWGEFTDSVERWGANMLSLSNQSSKFVDTSDRPEIRPRALRVAVLDVDVERANRVAHDLCDAAFTCRRYSSAQALIHGQHTQPSDLVVLGCDSEGSSCDASLHQIRQDSQTCRLPVLVLGPAANHHLVSMMESGADAMEIWPVSASVLVARVSALLRRAYRSEPVASRESYDAYLFDTRSEHVWIQGRLVKLTPKEFKVALFLFRHQSLVVTPDALGQWAWERADADYGWKRTIAVHVSRIRQKLDLNGGHGYCLSFVANRGYRLLKL